MYHIAHAHATKYSCNMATSQQTNTGIQSTNFSPAGSVDEQEHEQGIAHFVEHITFLGSKKRESLLGTGARSNAYTDFHHTVFHVHAPLINGTTGTPMLPQVGFTHSTCCLYGCTDMPSVCLIPVQGCTSVLQAAWPQPMLLLRSVQDWLMPYEAIASASHIETCCYHLSVCYNAMEHTSVLLLVLLISFLEFSRPQSCQRLFPRM